MPTYEYECQSCHQRVEAVQKSRTPNLTVCANCGGELRKVFSAVGIVFKGSGFYKNDSRGKSSSATPTTRAHQRQHPLRRHDREEHSRSQYTSTTSTD